ncbi:MAG: roadblock/LC7 domain-containing protein [Promethearchaeota archaeon]
MKDLDYNSKNVEGIAPIINELRYKGNLTGVLYVKNNGELIDESIEKSIDSKAFASMCASVLESATEIRDTLGDQQINKIIAELENESIIIVKIDKNTFLVCILNVQSNITLILEDLSNYIHKIKDYNNIINSSSNQD